MADIFIRIGKSIISETGNYYKILRFLGSGANAFAYRCLCTSGPNRGMIFVLKIQYNLSTETRRERFMREAAFLQACNHPAILTQFDYGTYMNKKNSFPFIVTNFMPKTLQDRLRDNDLDFNSKIRISCELLSAVSFLQKQSIIHRDIKPGNIFINGNHAILGDFGLIKRIDGEKDNDDDVALVNETVMKGYPAMARYYRTPELVEYANKKKDALRLESDVFQLGLVLTEMFTGKNPLKPTDNLLSPIQLESIGLVHSPYESVGNMVRDTLDGMIRISIDERIKVDDAMSRFTGLCENIELRKLDSSVKSHFSKNEVLKT